MKKVLFLIHTLGGGGAEKVLVNLVNNLDPSKYDITLMTVIDVGILKKDLKDNIHYKTMVKNPFKKDKKVSPKDISTSGSLLNKTSKVKVILAKVYTFAWRHAPVKVIYRAFIKEKYDVEIAFLEGICAKIIAASDNTDSLKYSWIHVDLVNQHKSSKIFRNLFEEKSVYDKFDKIICVSNVVKDQFIKKYDIDRRKVIVRYNPIDSIEIINKSKEPIFDYIEKNKFTICSVGRLNAQKAFDRLLRIHKKLVEEGLKHDLWIIGEGTSKVQLEKYIADNNLEFSCKLLGYKRNPYNYFKQADLFVCSSIAEGFSTVASEAIVLGLPIVTTDCSGMKELLGYNNDYGIVTENDEDKLYEGIRTILSNKNLYDYYKARIIERKELFNLNKSIANIEYLLDNEMSVIKSLEYDINGILEANR